MCGSSKSFVDGVNFVVIFVGEGSAWRVRLQQKEWVDGVGQKQGFENIRARATAHSLEEDIRITIGASLGGESLFNRRMSRTPNCMRR